MKLFDEDRALDEFDQKMDLLNKETDINKQLQIFKEMQAIANNVSVLKGWPYNARVFWDKEAFFWKQRVEQRYREFILKEIITRINESAKRSILELGTGNTPYLKEAINLDISHDMLATIGVSERVEIAKIDNHDGYENNTIKRIQANVEHSLPIKDNCVDAIVAVFLCNYIERIDVMLAECMRVLKDEGKIVIVQSFAEVDNYHSLLEKHPAKELTLILRTILNELGFKTQIDVKDVDKKTIVFISATKS
ncbi:TPA: class I SAM-dependent methyltransferase [Candidatus Woesearchaeota archaeon]|nr:class I SAM-dependent methyltransferase [Candidatus Woesearchaeota archaeon]